VVKPKPLLAADLPDMVRAQILHRSRYGCVRCGATIHQIAELPVEDEPGWMKPSAVLLCPACIRTLGNTALESVQYGALLVRPIAGDPLFDKSRLPYHDKLPRIRVGGRALVRDTSIPVMVSGAAPIGFAPPTSSIGATRITLNLSDAKGRAVPIVQANFWCPPDDSWTFERLGQRYVIQSTSSEARAEIEISAHDCLTIIHLLSTVGGKRVEMTPDRILVGDREAINLVASGQLVGLYA